MTSERSGDSGLARFLRGRRPPADTFLDSIPSLNDERRRDCPGLISTLETDFPYDQVLFKTTFEVMRMAQFDLEMDILVEQRKKSAIVRSCSTDKNEQRVHEALFLGLNEATRRKTNDLEVGQGIDVSHYAQKAQETSAQLLADLISNKHMYQDFQKFYGGLMWGTDQERLANSLFENNTEFNKALIENTLNGRYLSSLVYELEIDIPYDERSDWSKKSPQTIFRQHPEIDYRRLDDEEFLKTEEGQKLLYAYSRLSGEILAERHKKKFEIQLTPKGEDIHSPLIPLSKQPIIESLVIDGVTWDKPRSNYSFAPKDLTELILDSDSLPAHQALVLAINTRLPKENRKVFDGPDEFDFKGRMIGTILQKYKHEANNPDKREFLRNDVLAVMGAYIEGGVIYSSVLKEYDDAPANHRKYMQEPGKVKEILKMALPIMLAAPDPEVSGLAEQVLTQSIIGARELAVPGEENPIWLKHEELMLAILDGLAQVDENSNPEVFERIATQIYGQEQIGNAIRGIAQSKRDAAYFRKTPEVRQSFIAWRKQTSSLREKSAAEIQARADYDATLKPAQELSEEAQSEQNKLVLDFLKLTAQNGDFSNHYTPATRLFEGLVERVKLNAYDANSLPEEYFALLDVAKNPNLNVEQRNKILWHVSQNFRYLRLDSAHLLMPVVLDLFEVALGKPGSVGLPVEGTSHGLAAITHLVSESRGNMFKTATLPQLQTLAGYAIEVTSFSSQLQSPGLPGAGEKSFDQAGLGQWQENSRQSVENVLRELKQIAQHYEEYQYLESVKVYPHIYYPWVHNEMRDFWSGMQWEMGPGQLPSRDLRELYSALKDIVENKFKYLDQYPEDFDCLELGGLESLLIIGHDLMASKYEMGYINTIHQKGNPFYHRIISFMPKPVFEQFISKYQNTPVGEYVNKIYQQAHPADGVVE